MSAVRNEIRIFAVAGCNAQAINKEEWKYWYSLLAMTNYDENYLLYELIIVPYLKLLHISPPSHTAYVCHHSARPPLLCSVEAKLCYATLNLVLCDWVWDLPRHCIHFQHLRLSLLVSFLVWSSKNKEKERSLQFHTLCWTGLLLNISSYP